MPITAPDINLRIIAPALIVVVTALVVLLGELVTPASRKHWLGYLSILGLGVAAVAALNLWGANTAGIRRDGRRGQFRGFPDADDLARRGVEHSVVD